MARLASLNKLNFYTRRELMYIIHVLVIARSAGGGHSRELTALIADHSRLITAPSVFTASASWLIGDQYVQPFVAKRTV